MIHRVKKEINPQVNFSKLTADDLFIKCGEWDTQQDNEPKAQQTRAVKQISIHPAFRRRGVHNDLALVHVNNSFKLDDHINPICLPISKVCRDFHLIFICPYSNHFHLLINRNFKKYYISEG